MTHSFKVKQFTLRIFAFLCIFLSIGRFASAQTPNATTDRGFSPGKSYAISDIETMGLYNGNLMLNVPLGSLPAGRGGMSGGISLRYDSKLWDTFLGSFERFGSSHDFETLSPSWRGGWQYGYKYSLSSTSIPLGSDVGACTSGNFDSFYPNKLALVMPDGSEHQLALSASGYTNNQGGMSILPDGRQQCSGMSLPDLTGTITYFTTDGTYLRVDMITDSDTNWQNNTWIVYSPDGSRIVHNAASGVLQRMIDRNGNYVDLIENATDSNYSNHQTTYLQDQLGRKVVIEYNAATNQDWIHAPGFEGEDIVTKVQWKNITVNKHYFAGEMAPYPFPQDANKNFPLTQTLRVVDKVLLPSQISGNLEYEFGYNVDTTSSIDVGWGEVDKVTLPSGAYAEYEYTLDNVSGYNTTTNVGIHAAEVLSNRPTKKKLYYKLEYDGATPTTTFDTWTYAFNGQGTTVTAPDGGATIEYYAAQSPFSASTAPEYVAGESVKTVNPDGSVVEKVYKSNLPTDAFQNNEPYNFLSANRFVKYEFVSITDSAGALSKTAIKEYSRDKNGNVTEIKEYDFVPYSGAGSVPRNTAGLPTGLPSGATPARITKTEYYNDAPDSASSTYNDPDSYYSSSSPRLLGLVKSVEVQNGSGTPKSRSEMSYDYTSYSSNTKGGNLITTKTWDSYKGGSSQSYSNPLTSTNSISTSATYDGYGNLTQTTDANGVQTIVTYGCINGQSDCSASPWLANLYPTKTEAASNYSTLKRTSTVKYDFYTGLATSATDVDNNITNSTEYDDLGRPTKVISAVGTALEAWTQTVYDDQYRKVIVKSDLETKGDARKVATQFYDQLGRVRLSKTLEDTATEDPTNETDGVKVQTRYKTTSGYAYQLTSNPYRADTSGDAASDPTMGWTRSKVEADGKHSEVETFSTSSSANLPAPWGSNSLSTGKVQTDIDADRTLVTDQAGKQRISRTNALGQLTDVWEIIPISDSQSVSVTFPNQSIAYGYKTSYQYDTLNNLTQVHQPIGSSGGQYRYFTYSSLSRLLSADNPESGTISYVYDNNGNLRVKIDARMIKTVYDYDVLNRVTNRCYTKPGVSAPVNCGALSSSDANVDTLPVTYAYSSSAGSIGKLIAVDNGFSKTEYTEFDILGRVKKSKQTTGGAEYPEMTYTYNLSGALVEQKYPSGRIVKNVLDNNGDLAMVQSRKNSGGAFWNYARNFTYTAAGAVSSMELGNFRWGSTAFNSRLQPTQIALGSAQSATDLLKLDYSYGTTANNGNIESQTITVPTVVLNTGFTAVQTYTYDSLNRIKDATETISSAQTWKQTFTYDRFGNRNFDEANTTTLPKLCGTSPNLTVCAADRKVLNPLINTSDNRLSTSDGYTFDSSGNTTRDAQNRKFTYDAENKQTKVETVDANGNVTGTIGEYFYDGDGKRVKKYVPSTGETTVFIYDASGKLVAENSTVVETTNARVSYLTNDHLGSPRINTDQNGAVTARHDYQPFGEEIATSQRISALGYADDTIRKQFTAYERDNETELDYAQARMYVSKLGRFNSPDPLYLELRRLSDPQQLDLYNYTRNNPLKFADPTGLDIEVTGETTDDYINRLQQNVSFKINRNSQTRKVQIVDDKGNVLDKKALNKLGKGFKGGEKELFKAITDEKNHAVIDTVRESGDVDFGRFYGKGHNTIDSSDLSILDNSSNNAGFTAAHVVGHETLEAYHSAINQTTTSTDSHNYANGFFAGITQAADQSSATLTVASGGSIRDYSPSNFKTAPINGVVTHASSVFNIQGTNTNIRIEKQFITPVPVNASLPGSTSAHIVDVRREP